MDDLALSGIRAAADAAYCAYVNILNSDKCKGTASMLEKGEFRWENLQEFCRAHEQLGRHRALHEVLSMRTVDDDPTHDPANADETREALSLAALRVLVQKQDVEIARLRGERNSLSENLRKHFPTGLRVSQSGYSLKTGWVADKRIVASVHGGALASSKAITKFIDDACLIVEAVNACTVHEHGENI